MCHPKARRCFFSRLPICPSDRSDIHGRRRALESTHPVHFSPLHWAALGGHCGRTNHPVGYRPVLRLRGFFPGPWNEAFRVRCSASSVEVFFLKSRTYPADKRLFWGDRGMLGQTWRTHNIDSVGMIQRPIRWRYRSAIDRQLTHQPMVYNDSGESHP